MLLTAPVNESDQPELTGLPLIGGCCLRLALSVLGASSCPLAPLPDIAQANWTLCRQYQCEYSSGAGMLPAPDASVHPYRYLEAGWQEPALKPAIPGVPLKASVIAGGWGQLCRCL